MQCKILDAQLHLKLDVECNFPSLEEHGSLQGLRNDRSQKTSMILRLITFICSDIFIKTAERFTSKFR